MYHHTDLCTYPDVKKRKKSNQPRKQEDIVSFQQVLALTIKVVTKHLTNVGSNKQPETVTAVK